MSSGRPYEIGPDETPAGAGEVRKTGPVHGEDQTSPRGPDETPAGAGEAKELGRVHDKDPTSSRQESDDDKRSEGIRETGPNETPAGADTGTGQVREPGPNETLARAGEDGNMARVHGETQTKTFQEASHDTTTGRVHEVGPEETPAAAGELGKTNARWNRSMRRTGQDPVKSQDPDQQRDKSADTGPGRVHATGPDMTSAQATETDASRDGSTRRTRPDPGKGPVPAQARDGTTKQVQPRHRREPGRSKREDQPFHQQEPRARPGVMMHMKTDQPDNKPEDPDRESAGTPHQVHEEPHRSGTQGTRPRADPGPGCHRRQGDKDIKPRLRQAQHRPTEDVTSTAQEAGHGDDARTTTEVQETR